MSTIANIFQHSCVCEHLWCFPEQTPSVEVLAVLYCVTGRRPRFCALLLINNSLWGELAFKNRPAKAIKNNANPTAILQESYSNTTATSQVYHTTSTAIPQQSQINTTIKFDVDATAIPQQPYTNFRQSRSKTGARAEIPHSNCAVLTPQLHRAISQQSCKNLTVMPE